MNLAGEPQDWNFPLIKASASFLESWEWKELQKALGRTVYPFWSANGQSLLVEYKFPFGKSYIYSPRGPIIAGKNFRRDLFTEITFFLKKKGPIFWRIEPQLEDSPETREALSRLNFKKSAKPTQPDCTLMLDLAQSPESLLKGMEHETRYAIRLAKKRGVKEIILKTEEEKKIGFEKFWKIFAETNERHGLRSYSRDYYYRAAMLKGDCHSEIILAELEGKTIGAAILVFFGKTATYLFAASSAGYGRFNAPSAIMWASIVRAKEKGCLTFDFWGISEKNKAWKGITAFKKNFGGREIKYVGAWDLVFSPFWYFLYGLFRK